MFVGASANKATVKGKMTTSPWEANRPVIETNTLSRSQRLVKDVS